MIAKTLAVIGEEVNARFFERRPVVEALTLAVLAKEHVFILGPPGTGKSQLTREFLGRITGATYFEQLLSKTRPDQAILGPYDLPALRDHGVFRRKIDGFLLTADFAFLDEIGKMSATTGHDLLAALNERVRHEVDGSASVHPIPLRTAVTASNELPAGESEDAEALWDRLLVRVAVDYIAEPGNFAALLASAVADPLRVTATTVPFADLADVVDNHIPLIPVPTVVIEAVLTLRHELATAGIRPSDRRWRASMRLTQAAAFMTGRERVEVDDIGVLRYSLWDTPDQRPLVERAALKIANPLNEECMVIMDSVVGIRAEMTSRRGKSLAQRAGYGSEALAKLKNLQRDTARLRQRCLNAGRSTTRADEVGDEITATVRTVYVDCLDMDPAKVGDMK